MSWNNVPSIRRCRTMASTAARRASSNDAISCCGNAIMRSLSPANITTTDTMYTKLIPGCFTYSTPANTTSTATTTAKKRRDPSVHAVNTIAVACVAIFGGTEKLPGVSYQPAMPTRVIITIAKANHRIMASHHAGIRCNIRAVATTTANAVQFMTASVQ